MNTMKIFDYGEKQVRAIMVGDSPWFVGKDIAENLGYSNTRDAILNHIPKSVTQNSRHHHFLTFVGFQS